MENYSQQLKYTEKTGTTFPLYKERTGTAFPSDSNPAFRKHLRSYLFQLSFSSL